MLLPSKSGFPFSSENRMQADAAVELTGRATHLILA
jgi:hypothetical protein